MIASLFVSLIIYAEPPIILNYPQRQNDTPGYYAYRLLKEICASDVRRNDETHRTFKRSAVFTVGHLPLGFKNAVRTLVRRAITKGEPVRKVIFRPAGFDVAFSDHSFEEVSAHFYSPRHRRHPITIYASPRGRVSDLVVAAIRQIPLAQFRSDPNGRGMTITGQVEFDLSALPENVRRATRLELERAFAGEIDILGGRVDAASASITYDGGAPHGGLCEWIIGNPRP